MHLIHQKRSDGAARVLDPAWIETVRPWLPEAIRFGESRDDDLLTPVLDVDGEMAGWATQTFPEAEAVMGYAGPSNLLVIFDRDRRVLGTTLLKSEDTLGHVEKIVNDQGFFEQWNGRPASSFGSLEEVDVVSGATLTSEAMARGLAARFGAVDASQWFTEELTLEHVRLFFPEATGFESIDPGVYKVSGGGDGMVVLRSSRAGVAARGFQGPSDVLIGINKDVVAGVRLMGTRDNEPYTLDVADELKFADPFKGRPARELADREAPGVLVVSGASRTVGSVRESVKEMLHRYYQPVPESVIDWKLVAGFVWLGAGLLIGLSKLRSRRRVRLVYAAISVVVGGLWLGWMVAQDQWIAWAKRGSLSGTGLAMLGLTAAAVLVPAIFGKNVYCAHICPHGAAQSLLGAIRKKRLSLPAKLHRILVTVPWIGLILLWLLAFVGSSFPATYAEPFEIWSAGFFALMPALIFGVGLISAAFLPQAYCHYGCPTGALLKFLTHSPSRWTRRDSIAAGLVAFAWIVALSS